MTAVWSEQLLPFESSAAHTLQFLFPLYVHEGHFDEASSLHEISVHTVQKQWRRHQCSLDRARNGRCSLRCRLRCLFRLSLEVSYCVKKSCLHHHDVLHDVFWQIHSPEEQNAGELHRTA